MRTHYHHHHLAMYHSTAHRMIMLVILAVPFLFFLFFAAITSISVSQLFEHIGVSLIRMIIAYMIALALAWIAAVLFYKGRQSSIALPIFDVFQSFPTFAILPLATYALGASNVTIISFLILSIVWPILFSILSSLKSIKKDWLEAVEMSRLSGFSYIKLFLFPITIPGLVTGSIIGLGDGWGALIATEIIVGTRWGLGSFFNTFSHNSSLTIFGILGFLLLIFSINKLVWSPLLEWSHHKMEE